MQPEVTATPSGTADEPTLPVLADESNKMAAFVEPENKTIGGHMLHPFAAMRKCMLQITGNELLNMSDHVKRYCQANGRPEPKDGDEDLSEIVIRAIPEATFHLTALAYICVTDPKTLSRVTRMQPAPQPSMASRIKQKVGISQSDAGDRMPDFRDAVFAFWDSLDEKDWSDITGEAMKLLVGSDVTNDYEVKSDGAPAAKN